MQITEQDFISIRVTAKMLNISIDQVTFHIEEGLLTGYLEVFDSKGKIMERFRPPTLPPPPKLFRWKAIEPPIEFKDNEVRFAEAIIYDEHFKFHKKEISTSHRHPFHRPIDSIMLNIKDVERNKRAMKAGTLINEQPSIKEYIDNRRAEKVQDEIIALELFEIYPVDNKDIAKLFGLDKGLNKNQHGALKQRGQRFRNRGKEMLLAENCHAVTVVKT